LPRPHPNSTTSSSLQSLNQSLNYCPRRPSNDKLVLSRSMKSCSRLPSPDKPFPPTIRHVESTPILEGNLARSNSAPSRDTPPPPRTVVPVPEVLKLPFVRPLTKKESSEGRSPRTFYAPRDKNSTPKTPPLMGRARGKTVPLLSTPSPKTPDRDSESVLSFTPSTSSKQFANWFSGLLGR
jgi:hypothetical protein